MAQGTVREKTRDTKPATPYSKQHEYRTLNMSRIGRAKLLNVLVVDISKLLFIFFNLCNSFRISFRGKSTLALYAIRKIAKNVLCACISIVFVWIVIEYGKTQTHGDFLLSIIIFWMRSKTAVTSNTHHETLHISFALLYWFVESYIEFCNRFDVYRSTSIS